MAETEPDCPPLVWGGGPRVLDVFLEPTCSHSGRAFGKLKPFLAAMGEEALTLRIQMHSQPWHLFSPVITRAVLAASATAGGKDAAFRVMEAVFAHREEFTCTDHCSGPNMDAAPADMLRRIAGHTGIDLSEAFRLPSVTRAMKRAARFARQNGIHVSPTFMVDGLVVDGMGSRDELSKWAEDVRLPLRQAANG